MSQEPRKNPSALTVVLVEIRCMLLTLTLLGRRKIQLSSSEVGRRITFGDGTTSTVYRETTREPPPATDPVLLAVRFRLRFLGSSRVGHAVFRFESLLNTLLFAAHEGFQTKLWLTDKDTGFYRGLYERADPRSAVEYAETLRVVLRPWVQSGMFAYRIVEDVSRADFLDGRLMPPEGDPATPWWLPVPESGRVRPARDAYDEVADA